jgi:hypothetical protein
MSRDWSRGAFDDFVIDPRLSRAAGVVALAARETTECGTASARAKAARAQAGMAGKCLLMGVMIALLYVLASADDREHLERRLRAALFASILAGCAGAASLACLIAAELERRYSERNWDRVSEFADPEYWR